MATNFLRFCRAGNVNVMAFAVGVSGVACGASVGRMLTGSGFFWVRQWHLDPNLWGLGEG